MGGRREVIPNQYETPAFKLLAAMTPKLAAQGWLSLETAPKDGTVVEVRIVHHLAQYDDDPEGEGWISTARAKWIEHNGGGWTWHGLCGQICQWRPAPTPPHGEDER